MTCQQIHKNIHVQKIVNDGFGLAYVDGKALFIYKAIPGDIVDVKVYRKRKQTFFGHIINMNQKSKSRNIIVAKNWN